MDAKKAMALGSAIVYGVSPLDVLPDIVPPFTFVDDLVILFIAIRYCLKQR